MQLQKSFGESRVILFISSSDLHLLCLVISFVGLGFCQIDYCLSIYIYILFPFYFLLISLYYSSPPPPTKPPTLYLLQLPPDSPYLFFFLHLKTFHLFISHLKIKKKIPKNYSFCSPFWCLKMGPIFWYYCFIQ